MDRKSQTALLRRKRQSMIKLLCNKCNGCASSSSHRFQICGSPKKNATIASEVLCVACNTRSAIRSTSSPAQIEICGVPIPPRQIVAVNLLFYVRACPHSGDYSGTSLGVRSVALLHSQATLAPLSLRYSHPSIYSQKSCKIYHLFCKKQFISFNLH